MHLALVQGVWREEATPAAWGPLSYACFSGSFSTIYLCPSQPPEWPFDLHIILSGTLNAPRKYRV